MKSPYSCEYLGIVLALVATAALFTSPNAFARIGETEAQIEARYGKPLVHDTPAGSLRTFGYRKGAMQIGVFFLEGKSAAELYSNLDKSTLSETEISTVLDANSFDGKWVKSPSVPMWKLDPAGFVAMLGPRGQTLMICTKAYIEADAAEKKKAERERLKGF
jgi:hypothetical protein